MAELAYQVTGNAYQADGQFAYQGSSGGSVVVQNSGGYFEPRARKRRTKEDIRLEREAYGIFSLDAAKEAVSKVATAALDAKEDLPLTEPEQSTILVNLLAAQGLILQNYDGINDLIKQVISEEIRTIDASRKMRARAIALLLFN
jgi:hypothetical protein